MNEPPRVRDVELVKAILKMGKAIYLAGPPVGDERFGEFNELMNSALDHLKAVLEMPERENGEE